jgi:hypothetical protein
VIQESVARGYKKGAIAKCIEIQTFLRGIFAVHKNVSPPAFTGNPKQ